MKWRAYTRDGELAGTVDADDEVSALRTANRRWVGVSKVVLVGGSPAAPAPLPAQSSAPAKVKRTPASAQVAAPVAKEPKTPRERWPQNRPSRFRPFLVQMREEHRAELKRDIEEAGVTPSKWLKERWDELRRSLGKEPFAD